MFVEYPTRVGAYSPDIEKVITKDQSATETQRKNKEIKPIILPD
jgi:hypothetical protein